MVDAKGKPVDGAKVTIEQTDGVTRKFETKTDKKGEFIQIGLQSAGYKVTAEKDKLGHRDRQHARQPARSGERAARHRRAAAGNDPAVAAKTAELREGVRRRRRASRAGKYDESIEKFNKALAINPKCHDCYNNIGYATRRRRTTTRPRRTTRRRSR